MGVWSAFPTPTIAPRAGVNRFQEDRPMIATDIRSRESARVLPQTPTVFIVNHDPSARDALSSLVRGAGWQSTAVASTEEFLAFPRDGAPGCLLLEQDLPEWGGLDLQRVARDRTDLPIIVMGHQGAAHAAVRAMKAGAFGFLAGPVSDETLLDEIAAALEQNLSELSHYEKVRGLRERFDSLSRREREVMRLVVSGRLNKQVGSDLCISEITVKAHRGKVMRKMQAKSFAELVGMAVTLAFLHASDRTVLLSTVLSLFDSPTLAGS
jgi:FixJ family two-component response regulator